MASSPLHIVVDIAYNNLSFRLAIQSRGCQLNQLRTVFAVGFLILAISGPSFAQNHPMPGSVDDPPVICFGCPETNASGQDNDGLPTWPYDAPLSEHVGRLVDSSDTKGVQHIGFRTARAGMVRVAYDQRGTAPPRVYVRIGEALGAYSLDSFFTSTLPGGMASVSGLKSKTGSTVGGRSPLEKITYFDAFLYPEATTSGWVTPLVDGQERLFDFDFDDRGYLYAAYTVFGWGIVQDKGETGSAHFSKIVQVIAGGAVNDTTGINPRMIFSLKAGSKYYAVVEDSNKRDKLAIWDVTNGAAPILKEIRTPGIYTWAKDYTRNRLAVVDGSTVKIYTHEQFVSDGAPEAEFSPSSGKFPMAITFDEDGRLWVAEGTSSISSNVLVKIEPTGGGNWVRSTYSAYPGDIEPAYIGAWNGWVAVQGQTGVGGTADDMVLFKLEGGTPVAQDLNGFFKKYYHRAPRDYAEPGSYANNQRGVAIVKEGSKTYLMYEALGIGDVYALGAGGPSLTTRLEDVSVSPENPNSQQPGDGPYPGDKVQFRATLSTGATTDIDWDFDNPDAGSDNERGGTTGAYITHQFSGLNTTSEILASKTVKATSQSDSSLSDTVTVNLLVPTPRIALASTDELVTASDFTVVAGEKFADASDGSIDSHYATWRIDGIDTKAEPDEEISVGGLGSHTVRFTGAWGKYNSSFVSTSPYLAYVPGSSTTYSYDVVPFLATFLPMTRDGSTITFDAEARYTTDTSILSAGTWTVEWTLENAAGSTVDSQTSSVSKNTNLPAFDVASADVIASAGGKVILKITVASGGVTSGYETFEIEQPLLVPDPDIVFTNCDNVGDDCSIRAISVDSAATSGWNLSWTVTLGGGTVKTGSTNPLGTFELDEAGTYTASVTENVWGVTVSEDFVVEGSSCSEFPSVANLTLKYTGLSSGCKQNNTTKCTKGETIQFDVSTFAYSLQDCDDFDWDFGDGDDSTLKNPTHVYGGSSTSITASVRVYNTNGGATVTHTIPFTGSTTTTCAEPTSASISWSASGCTSSQCPEDKSISFTAKKNGASLESCDSVTWDFGDDTPTNGSDSPNHTYSTPGTYTIEITISNSKGSKSATKTITIVESSGGGGNCDGNPPTAANISLTYKGPSSGCAHNNSIQCARGENVEFVAKFFGYSYKECELITWNFGDGSTATGLTATHAFGGTTSTFPVTLTVQTDAGSGEVSHNVTVTGGAAIEIPVLSLPSFPTTGVKGKTVSFTATSSLPGTTGWTWSFGDGTSSDTSQAGLTQQSSTITHTFNKTGKFTVKVQARNVAELPTVLNAQISSAITISAPPPEVQFLIPVVSHVGDAAAPVKWRTDIQIYNPDTTVTPSNPLILKVKFGAVEYQLGITRSTHIYEDFLYYLVGATGGCPGHACAGPIVITTSATQLPQIWSRTYVQTDTGTYGQFIPAVRLDQEGSSGGAAATEGKYYLAGLKADGRFRTNIGLVNPTLSPIDATIRFYDDRDAIHTVTKTLQPFVFNQFGIVGAGQDSGNTIVVPGLPGTRPFSVQIMVDPSKWVLGYASLIDNTTNDPIFIGAVKDSDLTSEDNNSIIVPGVSHTGQWRTDLTLFNADADNVHVDMEYFNLAGTKLAEAKSVPLDRMLQLDDVLKQGVLRAVPDGGTVPDGSGILRLKPVETFITTHPFAFVRTYYDTISKGTYGQAISGFPSVRANVKTGKPALIPAVRGGTFYRTNMFLVNVGETATRVRVSVLDPNTGAVVSTPEYDLAPFQTIPHTNFLAAMGLSLEQATLKVEIAPGYTGTVWAYASVIDMQTSDPEYVQAFPLSQ